MATKGDLVRCFDRSPTGALIAAVQISSRYYFSPDWRDVVRYQLFPDRGREVAALLHAAAAQEEAANSGDQPESEFDPKQMRQIVGFQIVDYTDDEATVRVAASSPAEGNVVSSTYSMVWADGDWKIRFSEAGHAATEMQVIPALNGYTPWGDSAGRP
jgi:hypothetical protein